MAVTLSADSVLVETTEGIHRLTDPDLEIDIGADEALHVAADSPDPASASRFFVAPAPSIFRI